MKHFLQTAVLAIAIIAMAATGYSQEEKPNSAGRLYAVAAVDLSTGIVISPFNGGFGLQFYLVDNLALRGTFGGTIVSGNGTTTHDVNASAALLIDIASGNLYFGPTLIYTHAPDNAETYTYGGLVGVRVHDVLTKRLSLGWEYPVTHSTTEGVHTWNFGQMTSGKFTVLVRIL